MSELINEWWKIPNPIEKISILHNATENCLKNWTGSPDISESHHLWKSAQELLGWLVLICISQDWLNKHYQQSNPYHEIPLQRVTGIEIFVACIEEVPARLEKPSVGSKIIGKGLIRIEKDEITNLNTNATFIPDTGWIPATTVEQAAKVMWKLQFNENGPTKLTDVDYDFLGDILTAEKKYLAVDQDDKSHPLLVPEICALLKEKLKGLKVVHFGLINMHGYESPLLVSEGELLSKIWLFLKIIEDYENP